MIHPTATDNIDKSTHFCIINSTRVIKFKTKNKLFQVFYLFKKNEIGPCQQ